MMGLSSGYLWRLPDITAINGVKRFYVLGIGPVCNLNNRSGRLAEYFRGTLHLAAEAAAKR